MPVLNVTPAEASSMMSAAPAPVLLDVRTREEFDGELGHLEGALLIPLQELAVRIGELDGKKGTTILVYCRTGRRSLEAAGMLERRGHDTLNVSGGMAEWNRLGLPGVERSS